MEKDIGRIRKRDDTEIVIRVDDFADKRGLTIREFVTSDRYTGFTKAGVRILAKDWPKFKEMINSVSDEDMRDELPEEQETLDEVAEPTPEETVQSETSQEEITPEENASKEELPDY